MLLQAQHPQLNGWFGGTGGIASYGTADAAGPEQQQAVHSGWTSCMRRPEMAQPGFQPHLEPWGPGHAVQSPGQPPPPPPPHRGGGGASLPRGPLSCCSDHHLTRQRLQSKGGVQPCRQVNLHNCRFLQPCITSRKFPGLMVQRAMICHGARDTSLRFR